MRLMQDPYFREARFGACLLVLLTFSLLAGCGGGGGGSNGNPTTGGTTTTGTGTTTGTTGTGTNTGGQSAPSVSATTASGLTASLSENSNKVSVNGTVTYTLTLTNGTAAAIPIHTAANPLANPPQLPTTPAAGLVIRNSSGTITFEPVPGTAPVFNGSLAPGQSLTSTVTASGFTSAGTYNATATFSDDVALAASLPPLAVTAQ